MMETEIMIRQLRALSEKHKNDKVFTFDTNWSLLCTDVANRLEELIRQPKVYDVDKVIEQLETNKMDCQNTSTIFNLNKYVKLDKAIEIVKRGGIDE